MNITNVMQLLYVGLSEPFMTQHARRMDFFNEACLGLICYFLFMYNDNIPNEDLKYMIGWAQVAVFSFNILVNSAGVVKSVVMDTYKVIVKKYRLAIWRRNKTVE
jgi:hypothetical protein